jgi:itaconate CoA-transferase
MSDPTRPLEGLLVVSIEQAVAAPLCTVRLADAGARVIKIERPEGETARHYDSAVGGMSAYFVWLNRGKMSAALDLKSDADLALLQRMVAKADVLVQNLAPGAIDRLGLSAEGSAARWKEGQCSQAFSACGGLRSAARSPRARSGYRAHPR